MEDNHFTPYLFKPFPKMPRFNRLWIVTEKLDGTNGAIFIDDSGPSTIVRAGSRNRWISPGKQDNHGFAGWVEEHEEELKQLGTGFHYGEWWGAGIGKRYPDQPKTFSLFNVQRWHWLYQDARGPQPSCCDVVPVLAQADSLFALDVEAKMALKTLAEFGSYVATGAKAEGIVCYSTAANQAFKITLEGDAKPKGDNRT